MKEQAQKLESYGEVKDRLDKIEHLLVTRAPAAATPIAPRVPGYPAHISTEGVAPPVLLSASSGSGPASSSTGSGFREHVNPPAAKLQRTRPRGGKNRAPLQHVQFSFQTILFVLQ